MFLLASTAALAACGARARPPRITPDPAPMQRATLVVERPAPPAAAPPPVVPATVAAPHRTAFRQARRSGRRAPPARVDAANRAALQEPRADGFVNAVQVYAWMEGGVYRLYAAPEQVTDIALQPGESLTAVAAGDTVRWVVGDTSSGSGPSRRVHVLVKPSAAGLATNLVITTDRRSYHLQLESTARTAMAAVSWTYPQDQLIALDRRGEGGDGAALAGGLDLDRLRFGYTITGDNVSWRPLRAFDDGRQVFIEFPATLAQGEAPPLFVVGAGGDAQLVNYRVRGNYYVVDRLFAAAELRLGERDQKVVRIERRDGAARRRAR
jgi:type IV secretion system protein VirB9